MTGGVHHMCAPLVAASLQLRNSDLVIQARIFGDFQILFLDVEAGQGTTPRPMPVRARSTAKVRLISTILEASGGVHCYAVTV
jgi:hypothetical protein